DRPRYEPSRRRLVWDDGAVAQVFSSEDPDSLRGPQFEAAWCDEVAKWKHAEACFDMLQFGLRLGPRPMQLLTTTPKPVPLIRRLVGSGEVTLTRMRTADNAANLSARFIKAVERNYAGTRLGRQELEGELIEDREDALWTRAGIEAATSRLTGGALRRIVVAVDPPATG
ncbi:terminase large subunit domain-containing protein, partial [Nitratireductor sp. GCM10026969]|uniref:terminase large subunit domain-containing protein n=1 Tax=Nitratireductor sp. GCM10026969 TaxID=3252645 RepID=UPI0036090A3A